MSRDDGIDEDGHYDETKDLTFLKRFKKEYTKEYEEVMKAMGIKDEEDSYCNLFFNSFELLWFPSIKKYSIGSVV